MVCVSAAKPRSMQTGEKTWDDDVMKECRIMGDVGYIVKTTTVTD